MNPIVIVMGITASGKTTVARRLSERMPCVFQEGDDLHTPGNIRKLRAGIALTDEDRAPWLDAIGRWIDERIAAGEPGTVSCSALRRRYRDQLRRNRPGVCFALLHGDPAIITERLAHRKGHFASPSLLASQIATLELPEADEPAFTVPLELTPDQQCDRILAWLARQRDA